MAEPTPTPTPPDVRLLRSITLRNILSFGPDTPPLELRALNVLIGPNGSGKSNLLDAVELLKKAPKDDYLGGFIYSNYIIWRGKPEPSDAQITADVNADSNEQPIRHRINIGKFYLTTHSIHEQIDAPSSEWSFISDYNGASIISKDGIISLSNKEYNNDTSVLYQLRDPRQYSVLSGLAWQYGRIQFYREWTFGRGAELRLPRRTDERNDLLAEDGSNLGLILSKLSNYPEIKDKLIEALNELYDGIKDFNVQVEGGTAQIFLREGNTSIPATRLSDGTLRYLCLLAILLHPTPPPLICLEEPELGLHPDAIVAVGKLILQASERTQLIITTHSDILVDVLGQVPENIVVCEKHDSQTQMTRLNEADLRGWLERYSLSQLWTKGKLGGNRW